MPLAQVHATAKTPAKRRSPIHLVMVALLLAAMPELKGREINFNEFMVQR
jgi:hypothetical protein